MSQAMGRISSSGKRKKSHFPYHLPPSQRSRMFACKVERLPGVDQLAALVDFVKVLIWFSFAFMCQRLESGKERGSISHLCQQLEGA